MTVDWDWVIGALLITAFVMTTIKLLEVALGLLLGMFL
jgi:hypothetical protein